MYPRLIAYASGRMSLWYRPSAPFTSGSALRLSRSSGFQPHRLQSSGASFDHRQSVPLFPARTGRLHFFLPAYYTSCTSIPNRDRMNLRLRRYSFVRVGLDFTSSTTSLPPNLYEKSAVYRTARMRSPVSVM